MSTITTITIVTSVLFSGFAYFLANRFYPKPLGMLDLEGLENREKEKLKKQLYKRHRKFWGLVLTCLSILIGTFLTMVSLVRDDTMCQLEEANEKVEHLEDMVEELVIFGKHQVSEEPQKLFKELTRLYVENFEHEDNEIVKAWVEEELKDFIERWENGEIRIDPDKAIEKVISIISFSKHFIIATNAGSTDVFLDDPSYVASNKEGTLNGLPSMRIFIYDKNRPISLITKDTEYPSFQEFISDATFVHNEFKTTISIVVDISNYPQIKGQDFLISDNEILAYSEFNNDIWDAINEIVTENPESISDANRYISQLIDVAKNGLGSIIDSENFIFMDDEEARVYYKEFISNHEIDDSKNVAYNILLHMLDWEEKCTHQN